MIPDAQRVAKAVGGEEEGAVALTFKQCVGRNRGAHLDDFNVRSRYGYAGWNAHQVANALYRRVTVMFRVFREKLMRHQLTARSLRHNIRKRSATVNPKLPTRVALCHDVSSSVGVPMSLCYHHLEEIQPWCPLWLFGGTKPATRIGRLR